MCIRDSRYFVVKPKNQWADLFIVWLNDPHNLDVMDDLNSLEEDPDVMGQLEVKQPAKHEHCHGG